jgi:hypothetical protein
MHLQSVRRSASVRLAVLAAVGALAPLAASAQPAATYYQCPGNVFTNTISAKEAAERKCLTKEAKEPTTIAGTRPRPPASGAAAATSAAARVDPAAQRQRDSDARRILESELKNEEDSLALLKKEYNNGEPERQGGEKNYQKYLDRVAEMKSAIARKEGDIAAIKREITKLPPQ